MLLMAHRIVRHPELRNEAIRADNVPYIRGPELLLEDQDNLRQGGGVGGGGGGAIRSQIRSPKIWHFGTPYSRWSQVPFASKT